MLRFIVWDENILVAVNLKDGERYALIMYIVSHAFPRIHSKRDGRVFERFKIIKRFASSSGIDGRPESFRDIKECG